MNFDLAAILSSITISTAYTVASVIDALTPFGIGLCLSLILVGIAFLGIAYMTGAAAGFVHGVANMIAISVGTLWVLANWAYIVSLSNATAGFALGAVGVGGVAGMFEMAQVSADRIITEMVGLSLAPDLGASQSIWGALAALIVLIGMSIPGILAFVAEIELLLGAAIAPMILPFIASPAFRGIGFSAIRFQIAAVVMIVVQGLISRVLSDAVLAAINPLVVPPNIEMGNPAIQTLVVVAILAVVLAFAGTWVALSITSGSPGSLGGAAIARMSAAVSSATAGATRGVSSAIGGGMGGASKASGGKGGGGSQSAGAVQSKSKGSAFDA